MRSAGLTDFYWVCRRSSVRRLRRSGPLAQSLAHGDVMPQYAFLWGAVEYLGVKDADLILENRFGNSKELNAKEVSGVPTLAETTEYYASVFEKIKDADVPAIGELTFEGAKQGDLSAISKTYPDYQKEFAKYESLQDDTLNRMKSFEYEMKCYLCTELEHGVTTYEIVVTYSVIDPITGMRSFYTLFDFLSDSSAISNSSAVVVRNNADRIIENSFGGDIYTLYNRLRLGGYEPGAGSA